MSASPVTVNQNLEPADGSRGVTQPTSFAWLLRTDGEVSKKVADRDRIRDFEMLESYFEAKLDRAWTALLVESPC